jgi:hypothetical protein
MYYASDWAGPNLLQVGDVVCTKALEGKPGRVMEITLAGSKFGTDEKAFLARYSGPQDASILERT